MDQPTTPRSNSAAPMLRAIGTCLIAIVMLLGTYSWLRAG